MQLTPSQAQIAKDSHRFRVINCGRQFGKTTLAIEEIKGVALSKEARIVYIATTIQQARDIAWNQLKNELQPIILKSKEAPSLELEVRNVRGKTSIIQLKGWEAIETLRGQQFDLIVLDEVASMRNFWLNWQEVLLPTLSFRQGQVMFISTPKGYNHFYDLYNQELTDKDFKSFHYTSYDNPYLKEDEINKAKDKTTEGRFAQEYLAQFHKTEGLVYKEFDRTKHIYDIFSDKGTLISGIDFGYTNPAAVLHIYYTIKNDKRYYWIDDEWYKTQRTETQIAEYVKGCKFEAIYPDPESPSAIEELRRKGLNVREVSKGKDSVQSGIQTIRELLIQGRINVNGRCKNLIHELETYTYPDKEDQKNATEKPLKENDHALDALRYAITMQELETIGNYVTPPNTEWSSHSEYGG